MKLRIEPEENTLDHEMDFHLMDENGLSVCVAIQSVEQAREIVSAVNNHERLVEALWHAMQCWEYDGVSDEHGAVAMHCSELLASLQAEKGGEL